MRVFNCTAVATVDNKRWAGSVQLPFVEIEALNKRAARMAACRHWRKTQPLDVNGATLVVSVEEVRISDARREATTESMFSSLRFELYHEQASSVMRDRFPSLEGKATEWDDVKVLALAERLTATYVRLGYPMDGLLDSQIQDSITLYLLGRAS